MNKLIAALIAGAFALGSVAAMAADEDNPAYKMGMASQRQHDLELIESQATNQPPTTAAESKELREAAAKARAAYATMTPEQKAMYKKGMKAQRQMDLQAQEALAQPNPPITPGQQKAINAPQVGAQAAADAGGETEGAEGNGKERRAWFLSDRASNRSEGQGDGPALFAFGAGRRERSALGDGGATRRN